MSTGQLRREHPVTPLELFFDLVFVFAFTQVTTLLAGHPTWAGLGQALLVLTALWWAWAAFAWLTNTFDPEEGAVWGSVLIAIAAMFIAGLAVEEAFGRTGVLFGVAFLIVVVMQLALFAFASRDDHDLRGAVMRTSATSLLGGVLILVAGFVDGWPKETLWLAAVIVAFVGPLIVGTSGFRVAPEHFIERHGLIVIIAIGESLISIGAGALQGGLDAGVIVAVLLGLGVVASFWLAYFDFFPMRVHQLLSVGTEPERAALARDIYSYLHLPMVAGIMLFAFGMLVTLSDVGASLDEVPALCLCGGPAIYLLAYVALRFRVSRTFRSGRLIAGLACLALFPLALVVPAIVTLALITAVWIALHVYEFIWWREARAAARAERYPSAR